MKRLRYLTLTAASGFMLLSTPAGAQPVAETPRMEEALPDVTQGGRELTPDEEATYPSYEFNGWVDAAIVYDQLAGDQVGYLLSQVGLRMAHSINENFGGFVQLNAFGGNRSLDLVAREAYGFYQTDEQGFKVLAGKYYAPIGFELADPPDLYQFSNSLVFNNLIPTELVGVLAAMQFSEAVDLKLYTSGPWDDDAAALAMGGKNFGGRLGIGFGDLGGIGFSAVGGPQDPADEGILRIAYDVDAAVTPADNWIIGAEANVNMIHQRYVVDGEDRKEFAMPWGFLVMTNYAFTDFFNLTLRYDMVADASADDSIGGVLDLDGGVLDGSTDPADDRVTLSSFTVGPNFHLTDGWDIFTEVRYDMASEDVFFVPDSNGGSLKNGFVSGAVELIYQF